MKRGAPDPFALVKTVGLTLPDVEIGRNWSGAQVLKARGCFMAGPASHRSAEPGTLVVRYDLEERECLLEEVPATYYLTDYYRKYPLILARLSRIDREALHDLLSVSWRLTVAKARKPPRARKPVDAPTDV